MIDVSDGLLQDLGHVLRSSRVGAEIHLDRIPISKDANHLSKGNSNQALKHAMTDGEDFELLFTCSPMQWKSIRSHWNKNFAPIRPIGHITRRPKVTFTRGGKEIKFAPKKGYEHFS